MAQSTYSLDFGGTSGDRVTVASAYDAVIKNNNAHSVSFWLKADSLANNPLVICSGDVSNDFFFELASNGGCYWGYGTARTYPASTFATGTWYHVLLVKTAGTTGSLYVNGVVQSSYTGNFAATANTGRTLWLGDYPDPGFALNGRLDDLAMKQADWSASAAGLADGSTDVSSLAPALLLRMEEGTGDPQDTSGNGYHGTIAGTVTWSSDVPAALAGGGGGGVSIPVVMYSYRRRRAS